MFPYLTIPGWALGLVLLLLAGPWIWHWRRKEDPKEREVWAFGLVLAGVGLVFVSGLVPATRTLRWPTYGFMMLLGCLGVTIYTVRASSRYGLLKMEHVLELLLIAGVSGLICARLVFLAEQWDVYFADRPPTFASPGLTEPLAAGDELRLRTHAGSALVRFTGAETTLSAVRAAIEQQAGPQDVTVEIKTTQHREDEGVRVTERGFLLRTGKRGPDASLAVIGGAAAAKLGLQTAVLTRGEAVPLTRIFDLRMGGLTYFGSVFGVLLSSFFYLRFRKVSPLRMLDAAAPAMALGLFFGRLGCLSRGCCWGRELGEHAIFPGLSFPPWSPAWNQFAGERLTCDLDPFLAKQVLTPAMKTALGDVVSGTPLLHPAQLYEGIPVLLIFLALVAYQRIGYRRVGQVFTLLVVLQTPIRFVVEHLRRDHEVFWNLLGYPMTESQTVAVLLALGGIPAFIAFSRHGEPVDAPLRAKERALGEQALAAAAPATASPDAAGAA